MILDNRQQPLYMTSSNLPKHLDLNYLIKNITEYGEDYILAQIAYGEDVNVRSNVIGTTPLMNAVNMFKTYDTKNIIKLLIDSGADVNLQDRYGTTALTNAIEVVSAYDIQDVIKMLIDAGSDVNLSEKSGQTALMIACTYSENIVKMLVDAGADVNLQNDFGNTALMIANKRFDTGNAINITNILIEAGADVNLQNLDGDSALMCAAKFCKYDTKHIVKMLIDAGADVNLQNMDGNSVAMLYVIVYKNSCDMSILELFIEAGVEVNLQNKHGHTILFIILENCNYDFIISNMRFVMMLIENTDLSLLDKHGNNILTSHHFYMFDDIGIITKLIENGIDINLQNNDGYNALMNAASNYCTTDVIKLIVRSASFSLQSINLQDVYGNSALIILAQYPDAFEKIRFLIEIGADVNLRNNYGETALSKSLNQDWSDYSDYNNSYYLQFDITKILVEAGARTKDIIKRKNAYVLNDVNMSTINMLMHYY